MAQRAPGFDLVHALGDPGFTPSRRDIPALLDLLTSAPKDVRTGAERALRRAGKAASEAAKARAKDASPEARARLVGLVGRLQEGDEEQTFLLDALADASPAVRRRAADGLGRSRDRDVVGAALADGLRRETDAGARTSLIAALGKVGGNAARDALATLGGEAHGNAKLQSAEGTRISEELRKARVKAARSLAREDVAPSARGASFGGAARTEASASEVPAIDVEHPPGRRVRWWLECRRGLLPLLLEEASALSPRIAHRLDGSAVAEVHLDGPLQTLFASRLWLSVALPSAALEVGDHIHEEVIARAIAGGEARRVAELLTRGPLRYRLRWAGGGKRRAAVYRVAEAAARLAPGLINDPVGAPWEVTVRETAKAISVEWAPSVVDPRFAYRTGDVPAASHPTIAAALAFLAGAREDDVVWDPFVGSGLELCERARLGKFARLVGTDIEPQALEVARKNLAACGVDRGELFVHDAVSPPPKGLRPTLVITNPPMGRRVHRQADLRTFLQRFMANVERALARGGRLVWVSPFPSVTRTAAEAAGLLLRRGHVVDMGGFDAEIQVFQKA